MSFLRYRAARVIHDTTPDAFSFEPLTSAPPGTSLVSDPVTISGITGPSEISVSGPAFFGYSIDGGLVRNTPGTVVNGQAVRAHLITSNLSSDVQTVTIDVGGVSADWVVTNSVINVPPTTAEATASGDQDTEITIDLEGSDSDGTVESFTIVSLPANGTLKTVGEVTLSVDDSVPATANAAQVVFHPDAEWFGTTSFQFAAKDDLQEDATPATASITVNEVVAPPGDPPTITHPSNAVVGDDAQLAILLAANESVTWSIVGGADQAQFEISTATLRWTSNGTRDFQAPADAGSNNIYNVTVRATSTGSGLTADKAMTIEVAELSDVYNETVTLDLGRAALLSTGALATVPSGNTVNLISVEGDANVYLNTFPHYTHGDTMLGPGALWTGVADSGFNGVFPTDPTRETAKPELRMLTPWNQRIDGDITISVASFAAGGVQEVTFNLEGNEVTVTDPSHYYYDTLDGRHRVIWHVYSVTLDHAALRAQTVQSAGNSACNLFVTSVPNDPAMQNRVIGVPATTRTNMIAPLQFFPEATTHDRLIHLDQTAPANVHHGSAWPAAVATVNNISDALLLASGRSCPNVPRLNSPLPKATMIKAVADYEGPLDFDYMVAAALSQGNGYGAAAGWNIGKGYNTICAEPEYTVRLGRTSYVNTSASFVTYLSGIEFRGANVHFNQTYENSCLDIGHDVMTQGTPGTNNQGFWMNGCKVISDVDYLVNNGPTKDLMNGNLMPGRSNMPYFVTDCEIWHKPVSGCQIVRNNDIRNWWIDQFTNCRIIWNNLIKGPDEAFHDGSRMAFTLDYNTGHGSAKNWAIAERVGYGATSGTRQLRLSSSNDDITWTRDVTVDLGTHIDAAAVVAYINGLGTAWSATQTSTPGAAGDRHMRLMSRQNWVGDWTDNRQDITTEHIPVSMGGTANALTMDFSPDLPIDPETGFIAHNTYIGFVATASNTGTTTLNVDGLGVKQFRRGDNTNLTSGTIVAGNYVTARWNALAGVPEGSGAWIFTGVNAMRARRNGEAATQLALYTYIDIHADFAQSNPIDNLIIAYNNQRDTYGAQPFNFAEYGGVRVRDWFIGWNNWGTTGVGLIIAGGGSYENFRFVHNQTSGNLTLRDDALADAYCVMKNSVFGSLIAETPSSPIDLGENHYAGVFGTVHASYGNTNASTGVAPSTLYPGIYDGGAVPSEAAFATSARNATRYAYAGTNLYGVDDPGVVPKGVAGFPLSEARSFTYAESQTIGIAADFDQATGEGVKTLVFTWKDGPGNTGDDVQLTVTVDLD